MPVNRDNIDQYDYYLDPTRPPGPDGQGGYNIYSPEGGQERQYGGSSDEQENFLGEVAEDHERELEAGTDNENAYASGRSMRAPRGGGEDGIVGSRNPRDEDGRRIDRDQGSGDEYSETGTITNLLDPDTGFTGGGEQAISDNNGQLRRDYVANSEMTDRDRAARNPERHRRRRAQREFDRSWNAVNMGNADGPFGNVYESTGGSSPEDQEAAGPEPDGAAGSGHFIGGRELTVNEWNAMVEQQRESRRQGERQRPGMFDPI